MAAQERQHGEPSPRPEVPHDPQRSLSRKHLLRTPTAQLSHEEKLGRQQVHSEVLTIVTLLVLAMLVYSAIFDLDHWAEWIVFGAICFTAVGAMVALRTR